MLEFEGRRLLAVQALVDFDREVPELSRQKDLKVDQPAAFAQVALQARITGQQATN